METPNNPIPPPHEEEIPLDKTNPDSIYNWVAKKVSGPSFRNVIKDFIDDNCSLFIDIEENTFQQGQIFNEFNQLLENLLADVLAEGGLTQEQFLEAAQRGLTDQKYKKYFDQLLNFSDYNFFKRCMTKRNYALIKRFEEQISQQKKEIEDKKVEEEKQKEIEKEKEKEKEKENGNKEKTEKEIEEERQRMLLYQMLNQEEEKELQEVIKQSLAMEEEKRRIAVIEEEELNRALKQSLMESTNPISKKEEEPKKEVPKKLDFQIQKNDTFLFENQPKPIQKEEPKQIPQPKKPMTYMASSNNSFQFSGLQQNKEEKKDKINNNNFGISSENNVTFNDKDNNDNINDKKTKREIEYKERPKEENKKPEIEKVEIQRKKEEIKEKKRIINNNNDSNNKNNNNLIKIEEDNTKDENIVITTEIKTKSKIQPKPQEQVPIPVKEEQKPSELIKNTLNENKINENYTYDESNIENNDNDLGGYDRLLISDDEDEEKPNTNNDSKPLSNLNAFIDKKNDYNLNKVQIGKDGGNFLNNFSGGMKNYQKGGIEKLENKLKQREMKSVVFNPNEDDDFLAKLKEVEKEKNEKLKEYREQLTKMQKEKRENKAKQTLSKEELAKLQRRELLAEKLKAKRNKENNN